MIIIRSVFTFYKSFVLASSIITLSCLSIIFTGGLKVFVAVFWFKVITLGIIYFFINKYKSKELYYFKNLGLSKKFLWISTISIDMLLFILSIIITYSIK